MAYMKCAALLIIGVSIVYKYIMTRLTLIGKYGSTSYIGMDRKKNGGQQKGYRTDNAKMRMQQHN